MLQQRLRCTIRLCQWIGWKSAIIAGIVDMKRFSEASPGSCNQPVMSGIASYWEPNIASCGSHWGALKVAIKGSYFTYYSLVVLRIGKTEETPCTDKGILKDSSRVSFFKITQWSSSVGSRRSNFGVSFTTVPCIRIFIGKIKLRSIVGMWTSWLIIMTFYLPVSTLSTLIAAFATSRFLADPLVGS